jgi:hypothetical protein
MKLYKNNYTKYIAENLDLFTWITLPIIDKTGEKYYSNINGRLKNIEIKFLNVYKRSIHIQVKGEIFCFDFLWYINTDKTPDDYTYKFKGMIADKIINHLIKQKKVDYINSLSKKKNFYYEEFD